MPKRRLSTLSVREKLKLISVYENGKTRDEVCVELNVPKSTLCRIIQNKDIIQSQHSEGQGKLERFIYKNDPKHVRSGCVIGEKVVDFNQEDPAVPETVLQILKNGDLDKCKKILASNPKLVPISAVRLTAPVTSMDKVLCVGLNYRDHCLEQNLQPPDVPIIFSKFASSVIGPLDALKLRTDVTQSVDWEVELVVVMGKSANRVQPEDAFEYIAGYTIAQDISARDWQKDKNGGQVLLGKSMDTFCPLGPWIVTSDEIEDPQKLTVSCSVNNVLKQTSNTDQLIHKIPDIIARLTSVMTLLPGDIILSGTPGGVGMHRNPPQWLQPGDVIESCVEKIGTLITRVEKF